MTFKMTTTRTPFTMMATMTATMTATTVLFAVRLLASAPSASDATGTVPAQLPVADVASVLGALDPDAAVGVALARSDLVRSAELQVEAVRMEETAIDLENPQLQLGHRSINAVGADPSVDPFDDSQIGLSWDVPGLAGFGLNQTLGERTADAGWRDVEETRHDLALEVRRLHASVLSLRAQHDLATQRIVLLRNVATAQDARVREGLGTPLDAGLTVLDVLDGQAERTDLQGELGRTEQRLASLLGLSTPLSLAPPTTPLCTAADGGDGDDAVAALLSTARSSNARLRSLDARAEVLRLKETRSWLRFVPWVDSLQLGWLPQAGSDGEVRARVDIALPFLEPLNPELRVLAIEHERLRALRRGVEQDLEQKVRTATARLRSTVELVGVYEAATAAIDGSQDLVLRSLAADTVDVLRVATVQERVLRARRQALRARLQCDEAAIDLLRVTNQVAPPSQPSWAAP